MKQKFLVFFLAILVHLPVFAKYAAIENRTVEAGFEALQWMQFLHAISNKCENMEYARQAPRSELSDLVKQKLHVDLEKLEVIAEEHEEFIVPLYAQIEGVNCDTIDVKEFLWEIFDKYDVAKFNFELYEPISKPLITAREAAQENEKLLREYVHDRASQAASVLIVELIRNDKNYPERAQIKKHLGFEPDYVYRVLRGWKKTYPHKYLLPPSSVISSANLGKYDELFAGDGTVLKILFIKDSNYQTNITHIIGSVNMELYDVDTSFLKKHDFQWVGTELQQ